MTRAAVLRDPAITSGIGQFAVIQYVASSVGVDVSPMDVRDTRVIEPALAAFARGGNGGLIVSASPLALVHREPIIELAARHKVPAVYFQRQFTTAGGLISYGPETSDIFRRSASYVDRILKGANPAELPAQAPAKFEFAINLKTATTLGLTVAPTVIALADEVIE